jgi:hypothetical protein
MYYEYDFRGILELWGEEFGKLEGDFTFADYNQVRLIRNWAKRLVEPEEYEAINARVNARMEEQLELRRKLRASAGPGTHIPPYRFY